MKRRFFLLILLIGIFTLPVTPVLAATPTVSGISDQLICQCGCMSVLSNCLHKECHSRETITTMITQQIDRGQSEEQIIQLLVTQYGEQVLASPPKKGFNLMAWLLPFAAIIAGGGVIWVALRTWVRRGARVPADVSTAASASDTEYESRLENELKHFNQGGFR